VTPRVCDVRADKAGTCLGPEPQIGELITVLEVKGRLIKVQQTNFATCGF